MTYQPGSEQPQSQEAQAGSPTGTGSPKGSGWRTGFIILAVVLGLAVVAAIVWGVIAATGGSAPAPAPSTATPTASPTPTPTPTPSPSPTPTAGAACTADQLSITLGQPEGAAGSSVVPLAFANTGSANCTLQGFPQVAFVGDDNGTQLGAAAVPDDSTPVTSIDLAPGAVAAAQLTIELAENFENCTVSSANGFRVFPPNSAGAVFVPTTAYSACTNTDVSLLKIGAVEAAG